MGVRMGFRFQKRVTLIPGVRLNFSRSGISTSIGPRGMSLTFGKNGTYLNAGIPGSGLSVRERLDTPKSKAGEAVKPQWFDISVRMRVNEEGQLLVLDEHGRPLPPRIDKKVRQQAAAEIAQLLQRTANGLNETFNACQNIHLATPAPDHIPELPPPFALEAPPRPMLKRPGLLDVLLLRRGKLLEQAKAQKVQYQKELTQWQAARDAHEQYRSGIATALRLVEKGGYPVAIEQVLDHALSSIEWPRETLVDYALVPTCKAVVLEVALPDEDGLPQRFSEVRSGQRIAWKVQTPAQARRDFVAYCHGALFRLLGEVFAWLPSIEQILISGYIQRTSTANGKRGDLYILSLLVTRRRWQQIDFSQLPQIDPQAALRELGARVQFDRSGNFKPIEPYPPELLRPLE